MWRYAAVHPSAVGRSKRRSSTAASETYDGAASRQLQVCEGAMRRPILALLAACAVACTPMRDQAPAYAVSIFPAAESTRSPANGPDWKSDECDCLVTFSGVPND